ncbi:MAG: cell wall metabolism sensor histidine kinase WalK [Lachnospiraceae bacterium]|nr:cell wall metabolism sensor histidine kinase WalK [Lachnospiraceae bacterium]
MNKIHEFLKSLRFRIFLLILLFGIAPGFALRAGLLYAYETRAVSVRDTDITSQAKLLATQIAANDYLGTLESGSITAQLEQMSTVYDGRILLMDRSFRIVGDTYDMDDGKMLLTENVILAYQGETTHTYDDKYHYIEVTLPIVDTDSLETIGVMMVSVSTDSIELNLDYLRQWFLLLALFLDVLIIVVAMLVSAHMTKPLKRLAKSIYDVKDGYENDFKGVTAYSETEMISDACAEMLKRLQILDQSRQEFVSNVSHELKTPITSMKVLADSLIVQEDVPVEVYREFMTDIGAEIDRENQIINDLLSLVKMDKTSAELSVEPKDINEMLELIMKRLRPIARKENVDLVLESYRPVTADVDEVKLTLALSNLIENAIKYNRSEGWVHVSLNADHQCFYVTVEDNGIGIPEESLDRIFERFYRVDKSHSNEIGGTGLGLAIAQNAVILHRGTIRVNSVLNEGTTFTVRIPLKYIAGIHAEQ